MRKYNLKWIIVLVNLLILLVAFNYDVVKKEAILSDGQLVLLKLAPVDPRSLMQGDYMRLRYEIARNIKVDSIPKRGYCVVSLDSNGVGNRMRLQKDKNLNSGGEYLIPYTASNWNINIGAESFFFEEGQGEKFEEGKYGGLKIDDDGHNILIGLYDEFFKKIE